MSNIKKYLPDAVAVILFLAISFAYFINPVSQGLALHGEDHGGSIGAGVEMNEYKQRTGERTRWTNVLFSGMPTFQMAPSYDSTDTLIGLQNIYRLGLSGVVMYVFIMLLGFYILMRAFGIKPLLSVLGAVLWAFSSYFFILIAAGHLWKLMALAYVPPTLAGLVLCYKGRFLWGGLVTAFFCALQVMSNHIQMTYYFLFVAAFMALAYLIEAFCKKTIIQWLKATGVLIVSVVLGIAVNASNLYHTYQYSKESMRSKSELAFKNAENPENQTKGGLERDYITNWSYGIGETWSLLVPNVKGGASVALVNNPTAMKKANNKYIRVYETMAQYWGEQPGTSGPVYVGAFVMMLFFLSLFIVKGPIKWSLFAVTVLSVLLSWGHNFMPFTNFFLDYIPMYDKFRAVSSILVIAEFTIPLLAILALKEIIEKPQILKKNLKYILASFVLSGGVALLFALLPDMCFGNYVSSYEMRMFHDAVSKDYLTTDMLNGVLGNLHQMRRAVLVADAWRSFIIVAIGLLLLLAYAKRKINGNVLTVGILLLCLFDLWQIDKRYLNDDKFETPRPSDSYVAKTQTDEWILEDPDPYYRVLNFATRTFNDNNTSYYHKSIGGYHAAKLRRYQELIEEHLHHEMPEVVDAAIQTNGDLSKVDCDTICPVLNMLNMKYAIMGKGDSTLPIYNPHANGNGWFVRQVQYVNTADDELLGLHHVNPKNVALVNEKYADVLGNTTTQPRDSTCIVRLTHYDANALDYEVYSPNGGVVVFSEIYYPGWQATIDGQKADIAQADYILRSMYVGPGLHKISFKFDPKSLLITETIANTSLILLMLCALSMAGAAVLRRRKNKISK